MTEVFVVAPFAYFGIAGFAERETGVEDLAYLLG